MTDAAMVLPAERRPLVTPPERVLARSAAGMTIGRLAASGLGFVFWLAAARLFDANDVGVAAGLVAAMMLCTQLAHGGLGHALVAAFPASRAAPAQLVRRTVAASAVLGLAGGLVMVAVAAVALDDLAAVASSPIAAALFATLCALGTANIVLDHLSMATGRGAQVLSRNLAFGAATFTGVLIVHLLDPDAGPLALLVPWLAGAVTACALGGWQARALLVRTDGVASVPRLARTGLGHHLVTLAERAPGLVLPIVIAERVDPTAAAIWYPAWMMAWAVFTAPLSTGVALFAALAHDARRRQPVIDAARSGFAWAAAGVVAVALLARPMLSLLGDTYADGAPVAVLLVLGAVPFTLTQLGVATARASGRLRAATLVLALAAVAVIAGGAIAAPHGLRAVAAVWLAPQAATAAWAAGELRRWHRTSTTAP